MPRIKYKSISSGPKGSFQPGDERDVDDQREVDALVAGGYAVLVKQSSHEQAVAVPHENAVGGGNGSGGQKAPEPTRGNKSGGKHGRGG